MTNLRQAAQAVINSWDSPLWKNGSTADAIADLRTALEQQQSEPVAKYSDIVSDGGLDPRNKFDIAPLQQQAEPVALWQKRHPLRTGGAWENTNEHDAKWWSEKAQGWEIRALYTTPPQQQAELVAWSYDISTTMMDHGYDGWEHRITRYKPNVPEGSIRSLTPLYTTPPQRQWVGLTDEDFLEACQIAERGNYLLALQRIQIKLKERNNG